MHRARAVHRECNGAPVLFDFSRKQIRPLAIEQVAEAAVGLGEKSGFNEPGLVLERQKLHGLALLGFHHFAGDEPTGEAYAPSDAAREIGRLDRPRPVHGVGVELDRVPVAEETEYGELPSQAFAGVVRGQTGGAFVGARRFEQRPVAGRSPGGAAGWQSARRFPQEFGAAGPGGEAVERPAVNERPQLGCVRPHPLQEIPKTRVGPARAAGDDPLLGGRRQVLDGKQADPEGGLFPVQRTSLAFTSGGSTSRPRRRASET